MWDPARFGDVPLNVHPIMRDTYPRCQSVENSHEHWRAMSSRVAINAMAAK
jgi:hypothetical protein